MLIIEMLFLIQATKLHFENYLSVIKINSVNKKFCCSLVPIYFIKCER
jgi:hypothetical protein